MPLINMLLQALGPDLAGALADDDDDGIPDAAVLQGAIDGALAEARLEFLRVGAPFPDTPDAPLADIVVTLTVERLFLRRRQLTPGTWQQRFDRARLLLAEIGSGDRPAGARDRVLHRPPPDAAPRPAARLL